MQVVTPADREAARALREALADVSGFWYRLDDDGALCQAIAGHRVQAEQRMLRQAFPEVHGLPAMLEKSSDQPGGVAARLLLPAIVAAAPVSGMNCG